MRTESEISYARQRAESRDEPLARRLSRLGLSGHIKVMNFICGPCRATRHDQCPGCTWYDCGHKTTPHGTSGGMTGG
jgi:hypothetical protein